MIYGFWACRLRGLRQEDEREVGDQCRREGMVFTPLALESLGAWHEVAVKEVKKLGGALARHTGQQEGVAISRIFQRMAICTPRKW